MPYDVFISHSSHDAVTVDALCEHLEQREIQCWRAPRDIPPGSDWSESIIDAIAHCPLMIVVYSRHSNKSPQVKRELERAASAGKPIIPFRLDNSPQSKWMQFFLSTHQWFDAFPPPLEPHLERLAKLLSTVLAGDAAGESLAERYVVRAKASWTPPWILAVAAGLMIVLLGSIYGVMQMRTAADEAERVRHNQQELATQAKQRAEQAQQEAVSVGAVIHAPAAWQEGRDVLRSASADFESGRLPEARQQWERAAELFTESFELARPIRAVMEARDEFDQALSRHDPTVFARNSHEWNNLLLSLVEAELFYREEEYAEAVESYRTAQRQILPAIRVYQILDQSVSCQLFETPLNEVLDFLGDMMNLKVESAPGVHSTLVVDLLDDETFDAVNNGVVTGTFSETRFGDVLKAVLRHVHMDMDYAVLQDRHIYISSRKGLKRLPKQDGYSERPLTIQRLLQEAAIPGRREMPEK